MRRRSFLGRLAAASATALLATRSRADDYAGPADVLDAIDQLEAEVDARLQAIAAGLPAAGPFAASVAADHGRFRSARAGVRRRLGIPPARPLAGAGSSDRSLEGLRTAQQALVHAHAEGLPSLGDRGLVDVLARHMVEAARHLTVIELWIEGEANRG